MTIAYKFSTIIYSNYGGAFTSPEISRAYKCQFLALHMLYILRIVWKYLKKNIRAYIPSIVTQLKCLFITCKNISMHF